MRILILIFGGFVLIGFLIFRILVCSKFTFFLTQTITSLYISGTATKRTERKEFKSLFSTNCFTASNTNITSFTNLSDSNKHFTTGRGTFLTL